MRVTEAIDSGKKVRRKDGANETEFSFHPALDRQDLLADDWEIEEEETGKQKEESCGGCKYLLVKEKEKWCLRNPPQIFIHPTQNDNFLSVFPQLGNGALRCGEFKRKDKT